MKQKNIPKDIKFYDESGIEEKYFVLHGNEKGQKIDCYLILKQTFQGVKKMNFENEQFFRQPINQVIEFVQIPTSQTPS